jgi:hypothetical protein
MASLARRLWWPTMGERTEENGTTGMPSSLLWLIRVSMSRWQFANGSTPVEFVQTTIFVKS